MEILPAITGLICASLILRFDLRRRRLSIFRASGWTVLTALDVAWPAVISGTLTAVCVLLVPVTVSARALALDSPSVWRIAVGVCTMIFLWSEGRWQTQFQRPVGIVCGESMILVCFYLLIESFIFSTSPLHDVSFLTLSRIILVLGVVVGGCIVGLTLSRYFTRFEGLRILDRVVEQGEWVQTEYVPPTLECPHPERWKMVDAQTAELEVLDFLKSFVETVKPTLIVETGTFFGYSAIKMAEALRANRFGKIITLESDPAIFAKASEKIQASGLGSWIENRNESSLDAQIQGPIDLLFIDSYGPIREQETRRFLPQVAPGGLILMHDSSPYFKYVRGAALRLEKDGLISIVFLPTPRGLLIAQKLEGRIS
jgi:predicted O-methyltransferase YrrM